MKTPSLPPTSRTSFIEVLETRITPGLVTFPSVISINRATPATVDTGAGDVTYAVTFSNAVSGVDAADFEVVTSGDAKANPTVTVAQIGTSNVFNVTVSDLQGNGDVRLDLVDNDSITFGTGLLGGPGVNNGSFAGQTYHLLQAMPKVNSIAANPPNPTSASSVSWTVTFSEAVTGVDVSDFALDPTGVTTTPPLVVTPSSGPSATYTVTANGAAGTGTLGLNLLDDGTIKDADLNPLQTRSVSFATAQSFPTGFGLVAVASGDLDGDGVDDLAIADYFNDTVIVLLGDGTGSFTEKPLLLVGGDPTGVAIADVNGDGRPDIVASAYNYDPAISGYRSVSVLLGNGDGTFQPKQIYGNQSGHLAIAVGDLNADGKPDIVQTRDGGASPSVVQTFLGNGNGSFQTPTSINTGDNPIAVTIADMNGDGLADLVTANYDAAQVSVLLGNGDGTLQVARHFDTGDGPTSVVAGKFNGDEKIDLAVTNHADGTVSVLINTSPTTTPLTPPNRTPVGGAPTFASNVDYTTVASPSGVATTDVNGDGNLDLVVSHGDFSGPVGADPEGVGASGAPVSVLLGDGLGTFSGAYTFDSNAPELLAVTIADFNGDGKADIAAVGFPNLATSPGSEDGPAEEPSSFGSAEVFLNNGTGPFTGQTFTFVAGTPDLTITDIDDPAFAVEYRTATFTVHYANLGNADVSNGSITVTLPDNTTFFSSPGWTDNMDGTITASGLSVPQGGADQTLSYTLFVEGQPTMPPTASLFTTAVISSADTDSDPDNNEAEETTPIYHGFVVTAPGISPKKNVFADPVVRVYDRLTNELLYSFSAYEETYRDSVRVALGDFNYDGVDDIVTTTQHNGGRLRVFDGTTGEQFTQGPLGPHTENGDVLELFGTNKNAGAFVAVGNVNGYGYPEIVVGSSLITRSKGSGEVKVFSLDGSPSGSLNVIQDFFPFGTKFKGGVRVAAADVDGFEYDDEVSESVGTSRYGSEDDVIVGQGFRGTTVKVYKGTTLVNTIRDGETLDVPSAILGQFTVGGKNSKVGVSVAAADMNNDGHAEIIVGRNTAKPSVIQIFDGADVLGSTVDNPPPELGPTIVPFDIDPHHPKYTYGVRVAAADVNGDGVADIIASVGIKKESLIRFYDGAAYLSGNISEIISEQPGRERPITAFSDFLNVALWVAGSRPSQSPS